MSMHIYSASAYEELCTHVGVMMSGTLNRIGTPQDLRRKSGRYFKLTINVGDPMNGTIFDIITLREHVKTIFPGSVVSEMHKRQFTYYVPLKKITLASLFERMETAKGLYNIEDYVVEATSIEDLFTPLIRKKRPTGVKHSTL